MSLASQGVFFFSSRIVERPMSLKSSILSYRAFLGSIHHLSQFFSFFWNIESLDPTGYLQRVVVLYISCFPGLLSVCAIKIQMITQVRLKPKNS